MSANRTERTSFHRVWLRGMLLALSGAFFFSTSCSRPPAKTEAPAPAPSKIKVEVKPGGPIVLTTSSAEFQILPSGYIQASLLKGDQKLTLDQPGDSGSDVLMQDGKPVQFTLDFGAVKVQESNSKLGTGKTVEIPGHAVDPASNLQRTLLVEVYDGFPNLLLSSSGYKNAGTADIHIDRVLEQQHKFNASLSEKKVQPYDMWSFHGASYDWGKDDVVKLGRNFAQPNAMGAVVKGGYGGGIPVVAFWTGSVGEAVGHVETLPLTLSLPVKVEADGVNASVDIAADTTLKAGETYSTPRSFVSVYSGDFYEPLHLWSSVLQKEGWEIPKPSSEAYNVSWCGWGYEFNVTPAQMLGTVPKLKEFGIKWATLDDRWFDTYGDWNPRNGYFPRRLHQEDERRLPQTGHPGAAMVAAAGRRRRPGQV